MQVMIWTELKKLRRSRMLLVALFGDEVGLVVEWILRYVNHTWSGSRCFGSARHDSVHLAQSR